MHWLDAFNLHRKLEQTDEALHCGRNAVRLAAHDFRVRATVGRYLLDHGQFAEAEAHLAWVRRPPACRQEDPPGIDRRKARKTPRHDGP